VATWVDALPQGQDVDLYVHLREVFTDLTIGLMLDLDDLMECKEAVDMKTAAREHWRGLVTLQSGISKTYRTAVAARDRLLLTIRGRLQHENLRPDGKTSRNERNVT
jgi:hypothetical protein